MFWDLNQGPLDPAAGSFDSKSASKSNGPGFKSQNNPNFLVFRNSLWVDINISFDNDHN